MFWDAARSPRKSWGLASVVAASKPCRLHLGRSHCCCSGAVTEKHKFVSFHVHFQHERYFTSLLRVQAKSSFPNFCKRTSTRSIASMNIICLAIPFTSSLGAELSVLQSCPWPSSHGLEMPGHAVTEATRTATTIAKCADIDIPDMSRSDFG